MPNEINMGALMEIELEFNAHGPVIMYKRLAEQGYRYAQLALGVAEQNSIAGAVALSYMKAAGEAQGRSTDNQQVEKILQDMALGYLLALGKQFGADLNPITKEIAFNEAWAFHTAIFEANGYGKEAWTLDAVFEVLGSEALQVAYWEQVLAAAGNTEAELILAVDTYSLMRKASFDGTPEQQKHADRWLTQIESLDTLIVVDTVGTRLYRDFLSETLDGVSERFEGIYNRLFSPAPEITSQPVVPTTPVTTPPAVTPAPTSSRGKRKRRRRPGSTTSSGHPDSGHHGGYSSGGGGRLTIGN